MSKTRLDAAPRANRSRRRGDVPPYRHIPAQRERPDCIVAIEHDYEVGQIRADLEAPSNAASRDARRSGPGAIGEACNDEA